ncbi:putative peripheral membrane protein [Armillaria luteobubalina]|uniref:Autophagy-related protein 11 n=1 Tax=Armillaria luteobubalina TaxID=153913 RepID=A0AA39Q2L4_9AGAR|nr:putative peripheral membrane protein [Armillaria luteobubalina]
MLQICRAEDGQAFQVNATLRDIERVGSIELFLQQETGVPQEAVLAYLSDGRRLTNVNIRELAGAHDQSIYVFNKVYLDFDINEVLRDLRVEPAFQPPIEESIAATPPFKPSELAASYLTAAHSHHETIKYLHVTIHHQHEAVQIASNSLDLNVLAIVDTYDGLSSGFKKELDKQAALLAGLEADLDIISRVRIHTEFVSPAVRKAMEAGDKARTLGDYVSNAKMKQVAETCARTHDDLRLRFEQVKEAVSKLKDGTSGVRAAVASTPTLDEADGCLLRSRDVFEKITDSVTALEGRALNPDDRLQDLKQFDLTLRDQLQYVVDAKNAYTHQCISITRSISLLNTDMQQIPASLQALSNSFRGKNSFSHIQRLHNMLYAYGATVIEIVRRKEFSRFFYQRAQSILEVMAKLSANERKRRQVYRGEVHGQLPFETRGMDDPVPTIDFSPSGSSDAAYSIERSDVDGLLRVLDDLEQASRNGNDPEALSAVRECRTGLEKLVLKMDSLESGFDRIAERSLLSASRISHSRRRSIEADEHAFNEVVDQLRAVQETKSHQESLFQEERVGLKGEIQRLQSTLQATASNASEERDRADRLERELHQARAQIESETRARRITEERNIDLIRDVDGKGSELGRALAEATNQAKAAEVLRQQLANARSEAEDIKTLEARSSEKLAALIGDQATNLRLLEEARARGEDLEHQIQAARTESQEMNRALRDASQEKDRLLQAQASDHDRLLRDHIAEADGDRAVLEHRQAELALERDELLRQLKDVKSDLEIAYSDAAGLREALQRTEHELKEARHAERVVREDLRAGLASQSDYEHRLETSDRLVAQILDVALAFRAAHVKAMSSAQAMTSHPGSGSKHSTAGLGDSVFSPGLRHNIVGQPDEPSPIDPSDPATALEALRAFDHDHFLEAITKVGSTIRKWQKQCKEYRERAKGRISFRNFAKGDLALFLPTRNSISKPWAAFNVFFPHYFLQAYGHLAEQLKTREWIVARITSITERVVDHNDPTSNPYGLSDGVKYYMLQVEDWTQPAQQNRRRSSAAKSTKEPGSPQQPTPLTNGTLPPAPPEAEVEDTFQVTHPPTSRLFPLRTRANSSPSTRPSSLSRLLAQASQDPRPEEIPSPPSPPPPPPVRTPSPVAHSPQSPVPLPSSTHPVGSIPHHATMHPSPLRPGSRASKTSSASRFSVGRMPALGSVSSSLGAKATATTAISDEPIASSPSAESQYERVTSVPSPDDSISNGMSNVLNIRRRTTSYHRPSARASSESSTSNTVTEGVSSRPVTTASSALASLASSWGVSFGRKKKAAMSRLSTTEESQPGSPSMDPSPDTPANDAFQPI